MRIAVPLSGNSFCPHFGQATSFLVCEVQEDPPLISSSQELVLPPGGGCAITPRLLAQAGVNLVLAGGMGAGALANLARCGIEALTGIAEGAPRQIVQDLLDGRLVPTGQLCNHHDAHGHHGHGHEHGHGQGHGEGCCHGHGSE